MANEKNRRLIGKCPYCNGLFEATDLKEDHAKCQWCGGDVGTVEYVELSDERLILTTLLQDRAKLNDLGVDYMSPNIGSVILASCSIAPFVYFIYDNITGANTAWYIYVLMAVGAIMFFGTWLTYRDGKKQYKELKKLIERHDYSLIGLSSETEILRQKANTLLEQDNTSDEGELCRDLSEILTKLIPYVIAQGSVREEYADAKSEGIKDEEPHAERNLEGNIYIVPPSNCPACNYTYKQVDKNGVVITCPHCATTVKLVDESVRTQSQMMIRNFLLRIADTSGRKTSKTIMKGTIILSVISIIMMTIMGIERFFFSWAVIVWFPIAAMIPISYNQKNIFRMLNNRATKGVPDLLELEIIVKQYASYMKDEFIELKAEIIKTLNK